MVIYQVCKLNEITKTIILRFKENRLITQKLSDFLLWKNIIELIKQDEHLNQKGLNKIISLKASLNRGYFIN